MRVLLDTNILLRLIDPASDAHSAAVTAVQTLKREGAILCVVPQVIYEFWSVCTRPTKVNGMGLSVKAADKQVNSILRLFNLLRDERAILEHWLRLVVPHSIRGVKTHDARLAAAMLKHDISHVLTFDPSVFRRIQSIHVLDPKEIAKR